MAWGAAVGKVTSLFASISPYYSAGIKVDNRWYKCPAGAADKLLAVAADARRSGVPVYLYYETTDFSVIDIQSV